MLLGRAECGSDEERGGSHSAPQYPLFTLMFKRRSKTTCSDYSDIPLVPLPNRAGHGSTFLLIFMPDPAQPKVTFLDPCTFNKITLKTTIIYAMATNILFDHPIRKEQVCI